MEILIIGGVGQIGYELCRLLDLSGIPYSAPTREELNLENHKQVAKEITLRSPKIVINTAGYRDVSHATWEPSRCFSINRDAVANLAKVCAQHDAALIQISSWRVFNGQKNDRYTEKDTPDPESVLGNAFWQGEQQIQRLCSRHIILRLSWILSERGHNRATRILNKLTQDEQIRVSPLSRGCPTSAADAARVLLAITQQVSCGAHHIWGTYHYAPEEMIDEYALAELLLSEAGQYDQVRQELLTVKTSEPPKAINACLNSKRLTHTFGIKPRPWRDDVSRLVRSYYQKKAE